MKNNVKIFIGSDHAGFDAKEKLKQYFEKKKIMYKDLTPVRYEGDDYPEAAFAVSTAVAGVHDGRGILVCGSGEGITIAANKVRGIRAVAAYDAYTAKMSRLHNDANVLGLSGWHFTQPQLHKIVLIWLKTAFSGEKRHVRRIMEIAAYESQKHS